MVFLDIYRISVKILTKNKKIPKYLCETLHAQKHTLVLSTIFHVPSIYSFWYKFISLLFERQLKPEDMHLLYAAKLENLTYASF